MFEHGGNLRCIGSELHGNKQQNCSKVYDVNLTENHEPESLPGSNEISEKAFHAYADDPEEIDGDYLDALVASEGHDALVARNAELEEFVQAVAGMHDAMTTYLQAVKSWRKNKHQRI